MTDVPLVGAFCREEWFVLSMCYGGLIFDLTIVPLLIWKRTRLLAFLLAVLFHTLNEAMFEIGVFPWLMLAATLIFLPTDWPRHLWQRNRRKATIPATSPGSQKQSRNATVLFLVVYLSFQCLWPLRHYLYQGHPNWTEEGHRFSWHMMLRDKKWKIGFLAINRLKDSSGIIDARPYLSSHQLRRMAQDPELIRQFSHFLAKELRLHGHAEIEILVSSWISLNGRKPQRMIDPDVDLASLHATWGPARWIIPLAEPLRLEYWPMDPAEWPQDTVDYDPVRATPVDGSNQVK